MKNSTTIEAIQRHIQELLVPAEILVDFDIMGICEREDHILVDLLEKPENFKKATQAACVLNGYMNPVELQHFPITGKACLLVLKRRRWKTRDSGQDIFNSYQFHALGTKATSIFGFFFKSINW